MTSVAGTTFGIVGPLAAFPRRLAAREVERQHGHLRSGVTRRTSHVVFGRKLLERDSEARIDERFEAECGAGRRPVSENGFLRLLGLLQAPESPSVDRQALLDQSGLSERELALLSLFDAFEHDNEPYSFRDMILARKYAGLIAGGAGWSTIARSVHRSSGPVTSLTSLSLEAEGREAIYARMGERLSELDGQLLLPMDRANDAELEELFQLAEEAEAEERHEEAAALYERCLSIDPGDAVAAFNRANNLGAVGRSQEARRAYLLALKLDPSFVEAWFNLANLSKAAGRPGAARDCLREAIRLDDAYADAVYNLAALEFEAGNLAEARNWWARYLELDDRSEWARNATKGIQFVDLQIAKRGAG
ncbi:tetratricopeptide repeat protein [Chelativorans sp. AA-79]|uniref:tetratricopeptide repeat protein n=1 Tax=Chelativorans sp. AA-79 TaxID=3028735 RepID=UPI0023FA2E31|nr:tetratricopeptide repeat protein [Chelativorans sp. AA-79]WEX08915.1 tetratricopeptide repeat protein [Chelativorans sp. AA-79]